jgi:hypothetical protein
MSAKTCLKIFIRSDVRPGFDKSMRLAMTCGIACLCVQTWCSRGTVQPGDMGVTECTGYMGNNLGPNGLSSGSRTRVSMRRRYVERECSAMETKARGRRKLGRWAQSRKVGEPHRPSHLQGAACDGSVAHAPETRCLQSHQNSSGRPAHDGRTGRNPKVADN